MYNTSDHNPVFATCRMRAIPNPVISNANPRVLKWSKLGTDIITDKYTKQVQLACHEILASYSQLVPTRDTVDELIDTLSKCLHEAASRLPRSKFKKHLKPFWCHEMNLLKFDKIRTYKIWVDSGRPRDNGDAIRANYIASKKAFNRRLHVLANEYENENIRRIIESAEVSSNTFWNILKKCRGSNNSKVFAVKNNAGSIVHSLSDVLEVWRTHFSQLCTPKCDPSFDNQHFEEVNRKVDLWCTLNDKDMFLCNAFSSQEVVEAISKLNCGKAPGLDNITAEHLKHGGEVLPEIIAMLFNWIVNIEYIPRNFREGIQIPLHKGKNTSITDPDNFRGITLLSIYSKLFEIIIWKRMEQWWMDKITPLQGAGRKGVSCLHTAMMLQETVASKLEAGFKVFVTFFDVSKAFDSVWVNGLFFQLRKMGIIGTIWRLLYKMYVNFRCKVRIGGTLSDWYDMTCGIHQGGYLSLVKYISFINSLVVELENSKMCSVINPLCTSPVSYADDLATASTAKCNFDRIMQIAYVHSCKWRYRFNARKSAVLVYGESQCDRKKYQKDRHYKIGEDRVYERLDYDHVGVKACANRTYSTRTLEKIKKGRRAFFSVAGVGIKRSGINMATCNLIFWSIIVPITLFGSELWVLQDQDLADIELFQRQIGRRIQRFHPRSPVQTCFRGLGWLRLETFVCAKKVLFLRSVLCMHENSTYRRLLINRFESFINDSHVACINEYHSPIFDIFRVAIMFGMMGMVARMIRGTHFYSKVMWKKEVWRNAWLVDNNDWTNTAPLFRDAHYLNIVLNDTTQYLAWWELSNQRPECMYMCENMSRLVCRCSNLKSDCVMYKGTNLSVRACDKCCNFQEENFVLPP